jgi:hypothetical protein
LAAYQTVVAEAEEACGAAALDRQAEEVETVRSAIYEQILDTPAASFDGLAAHIRFLIDENAYPEEVAIILAGLDNVRRHIAGCESRSVAANVIGFGPR